MGMSLADDARIAELERRVADLEMRLAAHLDGEVEPDEQDPTRMTGVVRRKAR